MSIDILKNAALGALVLLAVAPAVQSEPQQALWKSQEVRFVYRGRITVYDCNVLVRKVGQILTAVGVHGTTRIEAESCNIMQPFGSAPTQLASMRIDVTSAAPVTSDSAAELARRSGKQALLDRLGVQRAPTQAFPAHWQPMDLTRIRQLKLSASDCELLRQLGTRVLDKLAIEIVERDASCSRSPHRLRKPILRILTLVPVASPDSAISLARD